MFYHSLISDWNHGNAHFLRGVATELDARGHEVVVYEDRDAWSVKEMLKERGISGFDGFREAYPALHSVRYEREDLNVEEAVSGADLVIVHEWNAPELVSTIGLHHARESKYILLFHDTHHRAVTNPGAISAFDLQHYDGVLVFGESLQKLYRGRVWEDRVWTWHEAADTRKFVPARARDAENQQFQGDLVWIGNWGDEERTQELREYLLKPVKELGISAQVYGVRYPHSALRELQQAGIEYKGWLPNYSVPQVFGKFRVTVHIPRRPYLEALPGIPTIRVFEALACGIPLVCSYWPDSEQLFEPGLDYLLARDGDEMKRSLVTLLSNPDLANKQAEHGLQTIRNRHTCAHRVEQLLGIVAQLQRQTSGVLL
jgi:spore maturation protein CgeB